MALEIERKFLVRSDEWENQATQSYEIAQGYLNSSIERNVRIRIKGDTAFLTVKGKTESITRSEFEYEIPYADGCQLMELCEKPIIKKIRYIVPIENHIWEIDVFEKGNEGLIVAEIELSSENETYARPEWLGKEVSDDSRYFNSSLIKHPFCKW